MIGVRASHAGARARPSVFPIRYNAAHHAGAPALAMVTIYHSPTLYRLTTRIGYGPDYAARYTLIADVIRAPGDVLELCCGDLALHRHLRRCKCVALAEAQGLAQRCGGLGDVERGPAADKGDPFPGPRHGPPGISRREGS